MESTPRPAHLALALVGGVCALALGVAITFQVRSNRMLRRIKVVHAQLDLVERAVEDLEELEMTWQEGSSHHNLALLAVVDRDRDRISRSFQDLQTGAGPRVKRFLDTAPGLFTEWATKPESHPDKPALLQEVLVLAKGLQVDKRAELSAIREGLAQAGQRSTLAVSAAILLCAIFVFMGLRGMAALKRRHADAMDVHEAWHRSVFQLSALGMVHEEPETLRFLEVNDAFCAMTGYAKEELLGMTVFQLDHPEELAPDHAHLGAILDGRSRGFRREKRYLRKDGTVLWGDVNVTPIHDAAGRTLRMTAVILDISERKELEATLAKEEELNRRLFKSLPSPAWLVDRDSGHPIACNGMVESLFGWGEAEFLSMGLLDLVPESHRGRILEALRKDRPSAGTSGPWPLRCKDGRYRTGLLHSHDLDVEGRRGRITVFQDFTELFLLDQEREKFLREAMDFRFALDEAAIIAMTDAEGTITEVNETFCRISGYSREELVGRNHRILKSGHHPPDFFTDLWRTITSGQVWKGEILNRAKDGHCYWVNTTIIPFRGEDGTPVRYLSVRFDISKRKAAEAKLLEALKAQESLLDAVSVGRLVPFRSDAERGTLVLGEGAGPVLGLEPAFFQRPEDLEILLDEEGRTRLSNALALVAPGAPAIFQARMQGPGGQELWTRWTIQQDDHGFRGVIQDVTEQQDLEARLRQAQKLDSLGTLASGIAHDFNNLLTAIQGSTEVLLMDRDLPEPHQRRIHLVARAAERGRHLVSKLSAFGRKSVQDWTLTDLNHVVHEAAAMAGHALPEEIQLHVDLRDGLPLSFLDPGQLHQALLNLVINARDATGLKGQIRIQTGRERIDQASRLIGRRPGDFLFVEVADEGPGISPELRARIFEPFFTTKAPGKGTGLGLAVVHGVVQRHQGLLELESEVGQGARFRLLLPLMPLPTDPEAAQEPHGAAPLGLLMADGEARRTLESELRLLGREVVAFDPALSPFNGTSFHGVFLDGEMPPHLLRDLLAPGGPASDLPWIAVGGDPTVGIVSAEGLRPIAVLPRSPSLKQLLRAVALL